MSPLEIVLYAFLAIAAVGLSVYVLRGFASGYTRLENEVTEQESAFERELLASLEAPAEVPPPPASPPPGMPAPEPVAAAVPKEAATPEAIARQLFALRVVTDRQGTIPMPMPPDGLIYGLRRGGSCGIVARQESPEMMAHFAKRFDLVFYTGADGETLVLQRLQGRLPELLDQDSGAPRP